MQAFTEQRVDDLIKNHNWELAHAGFEGHYYLRQKDKHYMKTIFFPLKEDFAANYLTNGNNIAFIWRK